MDKPSSSPSGKPARPPRKKTARKLTPEVHDVLVRSIMAGNNRFTACKSAGVPWRSFMRWMRYGREEQQEKVEGPCRKLYEAVMKAEGHAEAFCVGVLFRAMRRGQYRAAIAALAAIRPDIWGPHAGEIRELRMLVRELLARVNTVAPLRLDATTLDADADLPVLPHRPDIDPAMRNYPEGEEGEDQGEGEETPDDD